MTTSQTEPKTLPQMNEWEFKDLMKGRVLVATLNYQSRTGCTFEDAQLVAAYWLKLAAG